MNSKWKIILVGLVVWAIAGFIGVVLQADALSLMMLGGYSWADTCIDYTT